LSELELFARTAPGVGLNDQLSLAQYAFLRSADGFGLSAIANEVAQAADADAFAHIVGGDSFPQSWSSVETDALKAQRQSLVWQSLNGRDLTPSPNEIHSMIDHRFEDQLAPIPTLNCIPKSLKQLTARLVRESSLERLDSGWRSSQTLSLHGWRRGWLLPVCGGQREVTAIAWSQRLSTESESQTENAKNAEINESPSSTTWRNRQAQSRAQVDRSNFESFFGAGRLTRVDTENLPLLRHPLRVLVSVRTGRPRHPGYGYGAAWVFHHDQPGDGASPSSYWLFPNWQARLSVAKDEEVEFAIRQASKP
jgi:hypothetical protein